MADIVDDFLTRLAQHVPNLPADVPHQLERTLRQQWGGTEPYVGKRLSLLTRKQLVASGLRQQRPLAECFSMASVCRATGYQILQKK